MAFLKGPCRLQDAALKILHPENMFHLDEMGLRWLALPDILKSWQRQQKPFRGACTLDEPKVWLEYDQQSKQLYSLRNTHGTVDHTFQRRTCEPSLTMWSSLPTHGSQGAVWHTPKQKYIDDFVKWSVIPTWQSHSCASPSAAQECHGQVYCQGML